MKTEQDRCIALAGVFQAASLAARVARRGMAETDATEASILSLFQIDADSVAEVYGNLSGVAAGLKTLCEQLQSGRSRDIEVTRYVISLLHLERKLVHQTAMQQEIGRKISEMASRLEHFPLLHPNILAGLAEIYSTTISTLSPRIMVRGEPLHLQNPENINRIRTLLLAGIRSAMLWRQCGGRRLQILLGRKRLWRISDDLMRRAQQQR